jgi:hypothetical protein
LKRLSPAHLAAYLFYLVVAIFITWPLATVFSTRLLGHPFSDSYEYIHHIWWIKHALQTGQPLFFQPLLAYPDGLPAAWLWSAPLQSFPAWLFAFVIPLPAAYNLQALLTLALNGWALYWLVWKLTGQRGAAILAGVVFMAYPSMQGQMAAGHVGLLVLWPAPLYFYVLLRIRETSDPRWIGLGGFLFVLSIAGNLLLLLFAVLPLTALLVLSLFIERNWTWLLRVMRVVIVGGALSLIFILPTVVESLSAPLRLREGGEIVYSADLLTIITPSFQHPLFGQLEYTHRILGEDPFEKPGYVGVLAAILSAIAVWRRREARWWLLLAVLVWICSLGPLLKVKGEPLQITTGEFSSFVPLPWAAVHDMPIINIARTPTRFNLVIGLAVAVMAGYGAAYIEQKILSSRAVGVWRAMPLFITAILVIVILWDYQLFWIGMPTIPGVVPEPIAALSQRNDVRAAFDIPWEHLLTDKDALFLQIGHQRPLLAGHVTRRTPVDPAKLSLLQATLDPALLDAAGADIIILHKNWDDEAGVLEGFARDRLGDPFYEDERIAAWETPAPTGEPQFTMLLTSDQVISDEAESYLYAPEPGWITLSGEIEANGRTVELLVNGSPVHAWTVGRATDVRVPLFFDTGYHTVTQSLQPPCPDHFNATLRCRGLSLHELSLTAFTAAPLTEPIQLERGVQLAASHINREDDQLTIWLSWRFDQPLTDLDVRFIHVLDSAGNLIAQDDAAPDAHPAQSGWAEQVDLSLPDAPGTYTVYAGWYTNPSVTRFAVLSNTAGASDGLIYLGTLDE